MGKSAKDAPPCYFEIAQGLLTYASHFLTLYYERQDSPMKRTSTHAPVTVRRREWEVIDGKTNRVLKVVAEKTTEGTQVLVEQKGILKIGKKTADGVDLRDGSPSYEAKIIGKLE